MEPQDAEQKSFWRTLPGIITGVAGIITAITGLVVALSQAGVFHKSAVEKNAGTLVSTGDIKGGETQKSTAVVENKPVSAAVTQFEVQFAMTSIRVDETVQYQILESVVKPKDPQNSILTVKIRCLYDGQYNFNFWSSSFRLSIDDLPTAPMGYAELNEVVPSHSAKDGTVEFELPNNAKSLKFLIYDGDKKIEVPVTLVKK